jgi:hypothetical protein
VPWQREQFSSRHHPGDFALCTSGDTLMFGMAAFRVLVRSFWMLTRRIHNEPLSFVLCIEAAVSLFCSVTQF